ncbi:pyridoxamine 5'-phosphate oxidase family protein [Pullulanibacillus sp. KACC 23026]|uniref:pyridoxamine 5'-phosphate oxidase family protein n=1 Tax=Pullulanibacillus sp. KACC 23026 TaxID=3028315 RepID=UPI0023B0E7A6|nr:pyridoxamine 5'-phosphate oxidase family protein [Pullulanibacillus sp. KACC 23026]WEG11049.1 pyridoxamine 5'-phosphate oxidase family protein [Pullulanibacillus sp. KACC 23026]
MTDVQPKLSDDLYDLLNGEHLEKKQHEAFMLETVNEDGWPHTAMISVGEIIAMDSSHLRLALWPTTQTTQNILRTGKAMVVLFYKGKACYLNLELRPMSQLENPKHNRARFQADLTHIKEDQAKYADITSGVQIHLKDSSTVIARWQETLDELKQGDGSPVSFKNRMKR